MTKEGMFGVSVGDDAVLYEDGPVKVPGSEQTLREG
jgi:hypothetical protein